MNYKLFFDTSDSKKIIVRLFKDSILLSEDVRPREYTSQILLTMIIDICNKNNIKFTDLSEVEINRGPGSFTGLKVGAAVANTLGWMLKIPVNGKLNKIVEPVFE